jgi:NAD(P)-dependent dehydrogenase (short-subunit alcohol dehydrogenase family)
MELKDKIAVITGAGYGIGRGIAQRFAEEGADVVVAYGHNADKARETAKLVQDAGRQALMVQCDVTQSAQVNAMVSRTTAEFGRIDILINNAGIARITPFLEISEQEWDYLIDVDLKGPFLCTQAVAREMAKAGYGGKIINIGSVHGHRSLPGRAHYAAAKSGLEGLTKVMAYELAEHRINVNTIGPGATESAMTEPFLHDPATLRFMLENIPWGSIGKPVDIAHLAVFLASDKADYITGVTIYIDGGLLTSPQMV